MPLTSWKRPVPEIQPTTPVTTPAYRTETGFKQTPTPVNPNPRPVATSSIGSSTAPPTPRRPITPGRGLGALGVAAEGLNLATAAATDRPGGIGGAALESGARLGAAQAGAALGARLPGAGRVIGPAVGAIAGYMGGQKLVEGVKSVVPDSVSRPVTGALDMADNFAGRNPGAMGLTGVAAIPALVGGLMAGDRSTLTPSRPRAEQAPPAVSGPTGPSFRTPTRPLAQRLPQAAPAGPDPNQVVGTFNGRTITRGEADQLAAKLPTSNGAPVAGPNGSVAYSTGGNAVGMVPARPTGIANSGTPSTPTVRAPAADAYNTRQQEQLRRDVMSGIDSQLFALRGRTNTRSARELAGDLIRTQAGLANAGVDTATNVAAGDRDASLTANNANAQRAAQAQLQGMQNDATLEQTAMQQAADTERTRIARRPTTPTVNEDGTMGFIDDNGVFSPIVDAQGQPQRRQTGLAASDILSAYSQQINAIQEGLGDAQAKQAAIDQLNSSPLGQRYAQALGGQSDQPPVPGAKRASDGSWYVQEPDGGYTKVTP